MENQNYQISFSTSKNISEVYAHLRDPNNWWVGLFAEAIAGKSENLGDEFSFKAGDGLHYTKQRLIELIPNKKIVWLVTESNLTFLSEPGEWRDTKIGFDLEEENGKTLITFTHTGLTPGIECYGACSSAWTQYLQKLEAQIK